MRYKQAINTPIGLLWIYEENNKIVEIGMDSKNDYAQMKRTDIISQAEKQVLEYFDGKRKIFQLPLAPQGTSFQKQVWNELLNIPYGETRTYAEIARAIGKDKAFRAVGGANNKNPIMIVIPCHRVIGASGKLVGYALGLDIKERLLELEKTNYTR